jgi:uncharacterized membrane protein YedE/YeeE
VTLVVAFATGALFAVGLLISGMTDPAKVIGFLDVGGAWDPTLAFVMAGAIAVHAPFVRFARRLRAPLLAPAFHGPSRAAVDPTLAAGAAVFGAGWGVSGYCPGPALVSLGAGAAPVVVFVGATIAGIAVTRVVQRAANASKPSATPNSSAPPRSR